MEGKGKGKGTDSNGDGKDDATDKKGSMSSGQSNERCRWSTPTTKTDKKMLRLLKNKRSFKMVISLKRKYLRIKRRLILLILQISRQRLQVKVLTRLWRNQSQGVQTYVINNMTQQLIESGLIDHLGYWRTDSNNKQLSMVLC